MYPFSRRALGLSLAAALLSCERRDDGLHGIPDVFSGFAFVGEFPARDVGLDGRPHDSTALPSRWLPGPQYVFHLDSDRDFEEVSTLLLPHRLRAVGATVIHAPKTWRDMAIPNMGNPLWQIEFWQGRRRALLRNRFDREQAKQYWNSTKLRRNLPDPRVDDYVLTLAD